MYGTCYMYVDFCMLTCGLTAFMGHATCMWTYACIGYAWTCWMYGTCYMYVDLYMLHVDLLHVFGHVTCMGHATCMWTYCRVLCTRLKT